MGIIFALFYPFIIIAYALLLGAFITTLSLFIHNMRCGAKNHWPIKNRVGAIICGVIFIVAVVATIALTIYAVGFFSTSPSTSSSSSMRNAAIALMNMNL